MTDTYTDETELPSIEDVGFGHIPKSVKEKSSMVQKTAAEVEIAEKKGTDEWVHISELCDQCRQLHADTE